VAELAAELKASEERNLCATALAEEKHADLTASQATAEALRAALERVKEALSKDSVSQAWDAAYEALAAHSKAVGP
jgi:hemoglobin-like flavoprotein